MSSLGSIGLAANHLRKTRLHGAIRLDSDMGFVDNSAFSPALDQCRQSLRIRDAGKAISKRGVVGTKIARGQAMPRYSALVAGASMPVASQVSLTGYVIPLPLAIEYFHRQLSRGGCRQAAWAT